ncbi:hypothetical protein PSEUBRA_005305 [Kalmanozyma brasiliensis GHG001]|uniref:uncharacterized protein n=1 Tax=Kalmanozyma brasiliensis (strain GHG001) TaxID=1365824 RepID=UPI002867BF23|nr:uncharacterized protein PSEUBRA_005305 [Kalmanozyma brasiliensis GHG001]EST05612.2 hypothetical protein PSEUBRA_005305 [Kalmanozyma brasiliensis GHG001]
MSSCRPTLQCFHILCHKELRDALARDGAQPSEGLQAPCPKCLVTVHVVQLQTHQLPPHVYRYVQPFDASIQEIADVYKYQLQHMSELIRALEEVRKENVALKEEITVLRLPAPKTEPGTLPAQPSNGAHPLGMGIVKGQERMPPPSRSAVYQQAPPPNLRPPSRAMPAAPKADATFDDGDQIMHDSGRLPTRPSTTASNVFAHKPPPLSFKNIVPPTSNSTSEWRKEATRRGQADPPPGPRSGFGPAHHLSKHYNVALQAPLQRHSLHGASVAQYARPPTMHTYQRSLAQPSLRRDEDVTPHAGQTQLWRPSVPSGTGVSSAAFPNGPRSNHRQRPTGR